MFDHFVRCESTHERVIRPADGWGRRGEESRKWVNQRNRNNMDESVQKSCWGVTAKAVIGFAGILLLAWLFSGNAHAAVALAI